MNTSEKLLIATNGDIDCGVLHVYNKESFDYDSIPLKKNYTQEQLNEFLELMDSIPPEDLDGHSTVWMKHGDFVQFEYDYDSCNSDAYIWSTTYILTPPEECF